MRPVDHPAKGVMCRRSPFVVFAEVTMLMLTIMHRLPNYQLLWLGSLSLLLGMAAPLAHAQAQAAGEIAPSTTTVATTTTVNISTTTATVTRSAAEATSPTAILIPITTSTTQTSSPLPVIEITSATVISAPALEAVIPSDIATDAPTTGAVATTDTIQIPPATEVTAETLSPTATLTATAGTSESTTIPGQEPPEEKAPYMRDIKPIEVFDLGKGGELTPMQEAAALYTERHPQHKRKTLSSIQNLITFDFAMVGANEAQLRQEAMLRALKSAAARIYFGNYLILGRDLLEPYFRQYGKQFIERCSVIEKQTMDKNRVSMKIRVSVNLDSLYKDMAEKHFVVEPNIRPTVAVHLQEIVDGKRDLTSGARGRIERTMDQNLFRVFSERMKTPGLDADIANVPSLLKAARMEAQRNNIDVLITGTMALRPINQEKIYYDRYAFQEAEINLKMYRVDTGELIDEAHDRYSATSESVNESTQKVLDVMVTRVTQKLADSLRGMWANTMLEDRNCRLMISSVAPTEVTNVINLFKSFAPDAEVFQKAYYGDTLVVNVASSKKDDLALEKFLRASSEPQFIVRKVDKHHYILIPI